MFYIPSTSPLHGLDIRSTSVRHFLYIGSTFLLHFLYMFPAGFDIFTVENGGITGFYDEQERTAGRGREG
jgi:hypothetical protein